MSTLVVCALAYISVGFLISLACLVWVWSDDGSPLKRFGVVPVLCSSVAVIFSWPYFAYLFAINRPLQRRLLCFLRGMSDG